MDILGKPSLRRPQAQTSLERRPRLSLRESNMQNDMHSHKGGQEKEEITGFGVRHASNQSRKSTELSRLLTRQERASHSSNKFSSSSGGETEMAE